LETGTLPIELLAFGSGRPEPEPKAQRVYNGPADG
jgi:hypothetical protein